MYHIYEKLTNFKYWQRKPMSKSAINTYNKVFESTTGIKPSNNMEYYPVCSISKSNIKRLMECGYLPDDDVGDMKMVGLAIPMYGYHITIGGFLVAYKPPKTRGIYKWVTYTLIEKFRGNERPYIRLGRGPGRFHGYIVNTISDYLKLSNWLFDKRYKSEKNPPMVMLAFKGCCLIDTMRLSQYSYETVTDFTGEYYFELSTILKGEVYPRVRNVEFFNIPNYHCNILHYCNTRLQFEDALRMLSKSSTDL